MAQNRRLNDGLEDPSTLPNILLVTPNQLEYHESAFQTVLMGLCERGLVNRFVFDEIHMLVGPVAIILGGFKVSDGAVLN